MRELHDLLCKAQEQLQEWGKSDDQDCLTTLREATDMAHELAYGHPCGDDCECGMGGSL